MITIKRDENGSPSTKGKVDQVSVFGYYNGIKDSDHFFGYAITKEKVFPFSLQDEQKYFDIISTGYQNFLEKVKNKI